MNVELREIHEKRSQRDPVYRLLFNPGYREESSTQPFIDEFTQLTLQYVTRRYGNRLTDSSMIRRVYTLLLSTHDTNIKAFAILFILVFETEFQDKVGKLYTDDPVYNANYFRKIMCRVNNYVDQTLNFPYNKCNIVTTVENFMVAVKKDYMIG